MYTQARPSHPCTTILCAHRCSDINLTLQTSWSSGLSTLLIPVYRRSDSWGYRSTCKSDTKYYIREIKNLYVVGQTYPVTEVPGPHSRKITNTIKHRLQIIAFKLLQKSAEERLKISRLMKYFPDQNELQMRQRLKVCMRRMTCACTC